MDKTIRIYNLGHLPVADLDEFHELQEDFKIFDEEKNRKLRQLIVDRGFKYAFKAWKDPEGKLWIIDAHQRRRALSILRELGYVIPPLPYEEIFAEDKRDAVKEIAAYNSEFAAKNANTILFDKYNISENELEIFNLELSPVDLKIGKEDDVDWDGIGKRPELPETPTGGYKIKYEIIFDTEEQQDKWYAFIAGLKKRYPDDETQAERIIKFIEENG